MTAHRDDLAADLLADLAPEVSTPAPPTRPRAHRPTPTPHAVSAGPRTRGPAVQTLLRFEPFDWYKPLLSLERHSIGVRVGPVYLQLLVRIA